MVYIKFLVKYFKNLPGKWFNFASSFGISVKRKLLKRIVIKLKYIISIKNLKTNACTYEYGIKKVILIK